MKLPTLPLLQIFLNVATLNDSCLRLMHIENSKISSEIVFIFPTPSLSIRTFLNIQAGKSKSKRNYVSFSRNALVPSSYSWSAFQSTKVHLVQGNWVVIKTHMHNSPKRIEYKHFKNI